MFPCDIFQEVQPAVFQSDLLQFIGEIGAILAESLRLCPKRGLLHINMVNVRVFSF